MVLRLIMCGLRLVSWCVDSGAHWTLADPVKLLYLRPYLRKYCIFDRIFHKTSILLYLCRIVDRIFDRIFHKTFTVLYLRRIFDCIFDRIFVSSRYGTCPVDTNSHSPNLRTIRCYNMKLTGCCLTLIVSSNVLITR